jgi:hypothetical protein
VRYAASATKSAGAAGAHDKKTKIDFKVEIVRTDRIRLLIFISGDFGKSPFFEQLSVKQGT